MKEEKKIYIYIFHNVGHHHYHHYNQMGHQQSALKTKIQGT